MNVVRAGGRRVHASGGNGEENDLYLLRWIVVLHKVQATPSIFSCYGN